MKRGFFLKAALAAILLFQAGTEAIRAQEPVDAYATMTRAQKRNLKDLWKAYDRAERYAEREAALMEIKAFAAGGHFSVDYLSAGVQLMELRSNRNWKVREEETQALGREVDSLGFLLEKSWMDSFSTLPELVDARRDDLRIVRTSVLYSLEPGQNERYHYLIAWGWWPMPDHRCTLPPAEKIANDYEFALWLLLLKSYTAEDKIHWAEALKKEAEGRYPVPELAEYYTLSDSTGYVAFRDKYAGRGVSLLAEAWLIRHEKQVIDAQILSDDTRCRALRERCNAFDAAKRLFSKKGDDGALGTSVRDIEEGLDHKGTFLQFNDSSMSVIFQNVPRTKVKLKGTNINWGRTVENPSCRYYLKDTVRIPLPDVPDGRYSLKTSSPGSKVEESSSTQEIYSLAIAMRNVEKFVEFYVADSRTGRPVDSLSIWVARTDTTVLEKKLRPLVSNFRMDGFTPLPDSFKRIMADSLHSWKWWVTTTDPEGKTRRTQAWQVGRTTRQAEPDSGLRAALYLDHTVVQRGETLRFKGIVWMKEKDGTQHVLKEGVAVKAALRGPRDAKGDTLTLRTNAFGSVAGSFRLPEEAVGGNWTVDLFQGSRYLAGAGCTVGDIVLPSFDVTFDPMTGIALPGGSLTVSGKAAYLSGHAASGALVKWSASGREGETRCDENGRFSLMLRDSTAWTGLQLEVTTPEGETRSFSRHYNRHLAVSVKIENAGGGQTSGSHTVVSDGMLQVRFTVPAPDGSDTRHPVAWQLKANTSDGWMTVRKGSVAAGEPLSIDLSGLKERELRIEGSVSATGSTGKVYEDTITREIYRIAPDDDALFAPLDWYLEKLPGKAVSARFGAGAGDVWAIAELWGTDLLHHTVRFATKRIHLTGAPGDPNSLQTIDFGLDNGWSENLILTIQWFKDRKLVSRQLTYTVPTQAIPADYVRFTDGVHPGAQTTFILKTLPGVEGVATVYDKAMETLRMNRWTAFGNGERHNITIPYTARNIGKTWGTPSSSIRPVYMSDGILLDEVSVTGYGSGRKRLYSRNAASGTLYGTNVALASEPVLALAKSADTRGDLVAEEAAAEPEPGSLRSDLAPVLAFEPFLHPDAEGNISFTVKGSDRLSQFVVRTLVHDRNARSAVTERVMTVTLPVKVGLLPPALLHAGDRIAFAATAANASEVPVEGQLSLRLYDGRYTAGATPLKTYTKNLTVAPESSSGSCLPEVEIPAGIGDTLGVLVAFTSDGATDALSLAVPVLPRSKSITETHSMLLRGGEDLSAARETLREQFRNTAPGSIVFEEHTLAEMLGHLEESFCLYEREDAISLANALLVKTLLGQPTDSLAQKLDRCCNADGGYGWMNGMPSSPYVTAMLLDRFARIDKRDARTRRAIQYLDANCLGEKKLPSWRGGLSIPIYLYIRSLFPELPIAGKTSYARSEEARLWLDPRREDRKYASLFERALRTRTLLNLTASDQGVDLAKHFGITFFAEKKLRRSLETEAANLLDYAVEHPSGGWYYPNLVMPWRGLMESEAYAHTFMCDILRDLAVRNSPAVPTGGTNRVLRESPALPEQHSPSLPAEPVTAEQIADGVRLWLLVQRETQAWTEDPAYALAVAAIREGSPELLDTRILIARSTAELPFEKIKASGNGMKIERQWQVKRGGKWTTMADGTKLRVGETVRSLLNLRSDENRSFVVVTAPRPGNLQPVNQVSGYAGARGGYRDVRSDRTEYLFDAYPEEKLTLTEEYRVTHAGTFTAAPAEIVCAYADHYRATDRYRPALSADLRQ